MLLLLGCVPLVVQPYVVQPLEEVRTFTPTPILTPTLTLTRPDN